MNTMTIDQIRKVCKRNRYLLFRHYNGSLLGINCRIAAILDKKEKRPGSHCTNFVSYQQCSFNEYLNHKGNFRGL